MNKKNKKNKKNKREVRGSPCLEEAELQTHQKGKENNKKENTNTRRDSAANTQKGEENKK